MSLLVADCARCGSKHITFDVKAQTFCGTRHGWQNRFEIFCECRSCNSKQRRDLGLRLPWLFDNGLLPADLRELAHCIKEEGNDGAHAGTLAKEDAEDLLDSLSSFSNG
jgi:hypothetical protein